MKYVVFFFIVLVFSSITSHSTQVKTSVGMQRVIAYYVQLGVILTKFAEYLEMFVVVAFLGNNDRCFIVVVVE